MIPLAMPNLGRNESRSLQECTEPLIDAVRAILAHR